MSLRLERRTELMSDDQRGYLPALKQLAQLRMRLVTSIPVVQEGLLLHGEETCGVLRAESSWLAGARIGLRQGEVRCRKKPGKDIERVLGVSYHGWIAALVLWWMLRWCFQCRIGKEMDLGW